MKLEKTLHSHRFDRRDEETLIAALTADPPETRFVVRDPDEPALLAMPAQAVEPFVFRLKIRKRIPLRIAAAIDRNLPGDAADSIKVKLRISRFEWTERRAAFMERFFGAFESLGSDAGACLDFLTSLFEENPSEPDVFLKIADRKRYLAKALEMSAYDDGRLEGRNFETRIMTGQRPVFVDRGDAAEKIRLSDRIALALSA